MPPRPGYGSILAFGHEDLDDESVSVTQYDRMDAFEEKTFAGREVVSILDEMSGAFSLTPEMLKSGIFQPNP